MTGHRQCTLRKLENLPERVRALLGEQQGSYPRLEIVARRLCMSARTLKRYLFEHGVTFQQLLDQVRHADALRLLAETQLTLDEIALRVGYSSRSNFSRAFVTWVGQSPGSFRARLPGDGLAGVAQGWPKMGEDTVERRLD